MQFDEKTEGDKILKLVNKLADDAIPKYEGHIYKIWNDGEITCEIGGIYLDNNRAKTEESPLDTQGRFLPFPIKHEANQSFAYVTLTNAKLIRSRLETFFSTIKNSIPGVEYLISCYNNKSLKNVTGYVFLLLEDSSVITTKKDLKTVAEIYPPVIQGIKLKCPESYLSDGKTKGYSIMEIQNILNIRDILKEICNKSN